MKAACWCNLLNTSMLQLISIFPEIFGDQNKSSFENLEMYIHCHISYLVFKQNWFSHIQSLINNGITLRGTIWQLVAMWHWISISYCLMKMYLYSILLCVHSHMISHVCLKPPPLEKNKTKQKKVWLQYKNHSPTAVNHQLPAVMFCLVYNVIHTISRDSRPP